MFFRAYARCRICLRWGLTKRTGFACDESRPHKIRRKLKVEDGNFLTDDFLRQLIDVGEADILVGLPTHNNAESVVQIVRTIRDGILRNFPRERAVIINADGGSHDGTRELITELSLSDLHPGSSVYALRTLHAISTKYANTPQRGVALRTILAAAELLRSKACIVISPESEAIGPDWISR